MILPSKHLSEDRALLTVGAHVLGLLRQPKTVSRLWTDLQRHIKSDAPVTYDWFVLSLDVLYAIGAVEFARGKVMRVDAVA